MIIFEATNIHTMSDEKKGPIMLPDEVITSKIYFIRSEKVMIDRDLAELYQVETRILNHIR